MPVPSEKKNQALAESDTIPLSALQHYLFCPRQSALIHVEQAWAENMLTAEGRILHETTTEEKHEVRRGVRVAFAMPLVSNALGVAGTADLVELHPHGTSWLPYPVEYKRGKPKAHRADEVQLCAQAISLEEMFDCTVDEGALFYGKTRRRVEVKFDADLRRLTQEIAQATRAMIASGKTPAPFFEKSKCQACSLFDLCRPQQMQRSRNVTAWLSQQIDRE